MTKGNNTVDCGGGLEFYVSPNILTNDNREERTLKLQLQVNQLKTQQAKENIEIIPRAPSIVLSPKGTKQLLAANAELGAKSQARRDAEGFGYIEPPAIIMRDKEPFEIKRKLDQRPGVILPTNRPLTTAQNQVERMPLAPPILLKGNEAKPATSKPNERPLDIVNNTQLRFQNHIHNGVDEQWH